MYQIDYNRPVHIHFIGIGGISMSGLAAVLLKRGFTVSGSDAKESPLTDWLSSLGASIIYEQKEENIQEGTDVVVYTAAIHPDNPEYIAASRKQIPMLSRAELLGQLMKNYEMPVAYPREDYHHLHADAYSPGGRPGSHHLRGRHSSLYPRKRSDWPYAVFCNGSL